MQDLIRRIIVGAVNDTMEQEAEWVVENDNSDDLFCNEFPNPKDWSMGARDEDGNVIIELNDHVFVVRVEQIR